MKKIMCFYLLLIVVIFFLSCAEKANIITETYPEEQVILEKIVGEIFDLAKNKDLDSLETYHIWSPKFTKFEDDPTNPGRYDADMTKKTERAALSAIEDFSGDVQQFKADVFGDVAVVTFILDYSFKLGGEPYSIKDRSTMVFVKVGGEWKITHEHFSPMNYTHSE